MSTALRTMYSSGAAQMMNMLTGYACFYNKAVKSELLSTIYMASKLWNSLPDSLRMSEFPNFKGKILQYDSFL